MQIQFEVSAVIPSDPEILYGAWLDSELHSAMTGAEADVSAEVGGSFSAWDGYIEGENLELVPGRRILQAWRTVEFAPEEPNSTLEILFEPAEHGTKITIHHTQLPAHGMQYKQGWIDSYFEPMRLYFGQSREASGS